MGGGLAELPPQQWRERKGIPEVGTTQTHS